MKRYAWYEFIGLILVLFGVAGVGASALFWLAYSADTLSLVGANFMILLNGFLLRAYGRQWRAIEAETS